MCPDPRLVVRPLEPTEGLLAVENLEDLEDALEGAIC